MNLLNRKKNRLANYVYSLSGAYFITICVKDRECLFGKIVGDDDFIVPKMNLSDYGAIAESCIKNISEISKYVIMPNHIHLLIEIQGHSGTMPASSPTKRSVSQIVKSFKIRVTKQIGFSVWQRSFHDRIIRNKNEYRKIWEYIDTNALKWKQDCFYKKSR